eukprot:15465465-Alexandrium_andersonii.AAC.2
MCSIRTSAHPGDVDSGRSEEREPVPHVIELAEPGVWEGLAQGLQKVFWGFQRCLPNKVARPVSKHRIHILGDRSDRRAHTGT